MPLAKRDWSSKWLMVPKSAPSKAQPPTLLPTKAVVVADVVVVAPAAVATIVVVVAAMATAAVAMIVAARRLTMAAKS